MNKGKQFESDIKQSFSKRCFVYRLKDSAMSYSKNSNTKFTWDNPCDFFVFDSKNKILFAFECKSTQYKSMSVQTDENDDKSKMIKYHQIESLTNMSEYDGIVSGFLLNYRDLENDMERTYFLNIKDFNNMMKQINKQSFNELDAIMHGAVKVNGEKKRVHYRWNMSELLDKLYQLYFVYIN